MKMISAEDATDAVNRLARGEATEPVVVTVDGRPVAALVPFDELDLENLALRKNPDFIAMLERARRQVRETGGISSEDIRREFGLPERRS